MKEILEIINNHFGKILLVVVVAAGLWLGIFSAADIKGWITAAIDHIKVTL